MLKEGCPGSKEIREPKPENVRCHMCGEVLEIWTDEPEIVCKKCGGITTRKLADTCIDWCPFAKECIGTEKYESIKGKKVDRVKYRR